LVVAELLLLQLLLAVLRLRGCLMGDVHAV
jgi:hypothetical protein